MLRALRILAASLLLAAPCHAATHTVFWTAATGGTYYAYPSGQSLGDWSTYRVALTEDGSPNQGRYTGSVDDANGSTWYLFSGGTQPTDWGESLAVTTVTLKANVVQISDDATAADNLELATDGGGYNLGGGSITAASVTGAVGSVAGNVGGNVTGSVGSLADNGASITAMGWIAAWDAEVQSEVEDGLAAYDAATGTDVSSAGVAADRGLRAPSSAFIFRVSRRADGTYTTDRPLRLRPGTTESVRVGLDMGRLAPNQYVATVGTPAVSGGSLTATDPERYDELATFIVGGTATASEEQTIDVTVTMENGDVFAVTLPVEVFAD